MATNEPTQETPEGHTIPVPTRKAVFDDFAKVAGKAKQGNESEPSDGRDGGAEDQQGE